MLTSASLLRFKADYLRKEKKLFEELVAGFGNIIQQKRVLDADRLFPSSHVWYDRPSFHRKIS